MLYGMMSYCAKLADKDLSRYLNNITLVGLRNAGARSGDLTVSIQKVYISLPYIMAARTAGIDRNDEITSLSP